MRSHAIKRRAASIAATAVVVAAMLPGPTRAQEATAGPTQINSTNAGYLGILTMRCDCTLRADADVRKRFFVFRSDPVVTGIEAGSAAAGVLMRGDAITHIDGISLRTTDGARRFASIQPGQRVELILRRNGRTSKARMTAGGLDWNDRRVMGNVAPEGEPWYTTTWEYPSSPPQAPATPNARPTTPRPRAPRPGVARVWSDVSPSVPAAPAAPAEPAEPAEPAFAPHAPDALSSWAVIAPAQGPTGAVWAIEVPSSPASPRGWFGFSIRCNDCGWASSDRPGESPIWESEAAPELSMVSSGSPAARAGLRPGDILTHIDGVSILTSAGARKFGGVVPGQKVRVTVRRDGRSLTREMTLTRRPEARAAAAAAAAIAVTTPRAATPAARRELRYTGRLEDVTVEVWSSGGPTVERVGDTMVISVGGTVVRLRVEPKK